MRIVRRVLGWIATILFVTVVIVVLVAAEILPGIIADRVPDGPDWIAWLVLGVFGAGVAFAFAYVVLNPRHWRQWRKHRAETRERRRRLENFEIS